MDAQTSSPWTIVRKLFKGAVTVTADWNLTGDKGTLTVECKGCHVKVLAGSEVLKDADVSDKLTLDFDNTLSGLLVFVKIGNSAEFADIQHPGYVSVEQKGTELVVESHTNVKAYMFLRMNYDIYLGTLDPLKKTSTDVSSLFQRSDLATPEARFYVLFDYKDVVLHSNEVPVTGASSGTVDIHTGRHVLSVSLLTRTAIVQSTNVFEPQKIVNNANAPVSVELYDGTRWLTATIDKGKQLETQFLGARLLGIEFSTPALPLLFKQGGKFQAKLFGSALPDKPKVVFTSEVAELYKVELNSEDDVQNVDRIIQQSKVEATKKAEGGVRVLGVSLCTTAGCSGPYTLDPLQNWGEWSGEKVEWKRPVTASLIHPWAEKEVLDMSQKATSTAEQQTEKTSSQRLVVIKLFQEEAGGTTSGSQQPESSQVKYTDYVFVTNFSTTSDRLPVYEFAVVSDGNSTGVVWKSLYSGGKAYLVNSEGQTLQPGLFTVQPGQSFKFSGAKSSRIIYVLRGEEDGIERVYGYLQKDQQEVKAPAIMKVGDKSLAVLAVIVSLKDEKGLRNDYVLRPVLKLKQYQFLAPNKLRLVFEVPPSGVLIVRNMLDGEAKRVSDADSTLEFKSPVLIARFEGLPVVYGTEEIYYISRWSTDLIKDVEINFPNLVLETDDTAEIPGADVSLIVSKHGYQTTAPLGQHDLAGQKTISIADAVRDADRVDGVLVSTSLGVLSLPASLNISKPKVVVSQNSVQVLSDTWESVAKVVIKHCSGQITTAIGSQVPISSLDVSCGIPPVLTVVTPSGLPILLSDNQYYRYLTELLPQLWVKYDKNSEEWIAVLNIPDQLKSQVQKVSVERLEGRKWVAVASSANTQQFLAGVVTLKFSKKVAKPGLYRVSVLTSSGSTLTAGNFYVLPVLRFSGGSVCIDAVSTEGAEVSVLLPSGDLKRLGSESDSLSRSGCFKVSAPGRYIISIGDMKTYVDVYGISKDGSKVVLWDTVPHTVKCVFGCSGSAEGQVAVLPAVSFLPAIVKLDGRTRVLGGSGFILGLSVLAGAVVGGTAGLTTLKEESGSSEGANVSTGAQITSA